MKVVRSNSAHDLTKAAVVATITSFAAACSFTYAARDDLAVTAKEMKQPGLPDRYTEAPTELYNTHGSSIRDPGGAGGVQTGNRQ